VLKLGWNFSGRELTVAWLAATLLSGVPSTVYALASGGDPLEATRAAGAMLLPLTSPLPVLLVTAAAVHATVSLFWTLVFGWVLPRRRLLVWSVLGSAAVAGLDLRVIAPVLFPSVTVLEFWPQFADHLMWGACFGLTLQLSGSKHKRTSARCNCSKLDSSAD
jgi:hypothetical protein